MPRCVNELPSRQTQQAWNWGARVAALAIPKKSKTDKMSAVNIFPAKGLSSRYGTDSAVSIWRSARLACMQPNKTGEGKGEGRGRGEEVVYACDRGCGFEGDYDTVEKHEQVCDHTKDASKSLSSVMRRFCMLACSLQCVSPAAQ